MGEHLSPWPERRQVRTEAERAAFAEAQSAHLPMPDAFRFVHMSDDDLAAMKAAFAKRFNEELPRTETMMCVAMIGYRMALRDMPEVSKERDKFRQALLTVKINLMRSGYTKELENYLDEQLRQ